MNIKLESTAEEKRIMREGYNNIMNMISQGYADYQIANYLGVPAFEVSNIFAETLHAIKMRYGKGRVIKMLFKK